MIVDLNVEMNSELQIASESLRCRGEVRDKGEHHDRVSCVERKLPLPLYLQSQL